MELNISAQIAGTADYRTSEPIDRPITSDEHAFAIEVAHEMATKCGIDLDAHVAGQIESERAYALSIGHDI